MAAWRGYTHSQIWHMGYLKDSYLTNTSTEHRFQASHSSIQIVHCWNLLFCFLFKKARPRTKHLPISNQVSAGPMRYYHPAAELTSVLQHSTWTSSVKPPNLELEVTSCRNIVSYGRNLNVHLKFLKRLWTFNFQSFYFLKFGTSESNPWFMCIDASMSPRRYRRQTNQHSAYPIC